MKTMGVAVKSVAGVATVVISYVDHTLTPLFWALLLLAAIDVLLNVHNEEKQFAKIGSAFMTILGTVSIHAGSFAQPDFLRVIVAVAVLAYLQIVIPQVSTLLGKLKIGGKPASQLVQVQMALDVANQKIAELESVAQKQAAAGGSQPANLPADQLHV